MAQTLLLPHKRPRKQQQQQNAAAAAAVQPAASHSSDITPGAPRGRFFTLQEFNGSSIKLLNKLSPNKINRILLKSKLFNAEEVQASAAVRGVKS